MTTAADRPSIGRYRCITRIGSGGGGDVYLAASPGLGGFVKLAVVKVPRFEADAGESASAMFLDEARLAARLNHPNVVQTNEVGEHQGRYFIVMEFLDGQTLHAVRQRFTRNGEALPLGHLLRVLGAALDGLHYAHELTDFDGTPLDVVHRDVSPHNVFVTYDGSVKVLDFGIAKASCRSHRTETGALKGKLAYMAPEQCDSQSVDRRADVFSVGIILFEGVAGKRFWGDLTDVEILTRLLNGRFPRSPRDIGVDVPDCLDAICRRALAQSPDERYSTAAEMQSTLAQATAELGLVLPRRELGAMVAERFADERDKLRAEIDAFTRGPQSSRPAATAPAPQRPRKERTFQTLEELAAALRAKVGVDAVFTCVNTRLILQAGVNLKRPGASENMDPIVIARVMSALAKMGLSVTPEART